MTKVNKFLLLTPKKIVSVWYLEIETTMELYNASNLCVPTLPNFDSCNSSFYMSFWDFVGRSLITELSILLQYLNNIPSFASRQKILNHFCRIVRIRFLHWFSESGINFTDVI